MTRMLLHSHTPVPPHFRTVQTCWHVQRIVALAALVAVWGSSAAHGEEPVAIGPFPKNVIWPIAGTEPLDLRLRGTFGPRIVRTGGDRYDFHRGIDVKAPKGMSVLAIADGEVRLAGQAEGTRAPLVQIRHFKPDRTSCADGGCYYSHYMSLSEVRVKQGDQVKQGDVIGTTGWSKNNFEHLDFEIRDGGTSQRNCIHPLAVLPYENRTPPEVEIERVTSGPKNTSVAVHVKVPSTEADFNRVEVRLFAGPEAGAELLDEAMYDIMQFNRLYTPKDKSADPLDEPRVHGVEVTPLARRLSDRTYEWTIEFDDLKGVAAGAKRPTARVKAFDVQGKSSEAAWIGQ